jgi:hypothetical protein
MKERELYFQSPSKFEVRNNGQETSAEKNIILSVNGREGLGHLDLDKEIVQIPKAELERSISTSAADPGPQAKKPDQQKFVGRSLYIQLKKRTFKFFQNGVGSQQGLFVARTQ